MLSLTFDDGPDPVWTPRLLEALDACEVRATFFMIGERVAAAPETACAVRDAGHEIQLHCHRHLRHSEMEPHEIARDVEWGICTLARIGVRPQLWRPPWGIEAPHSRLAAAQCGLTLVRWSIDTHDWRGDHAPAMLRHARTEMAAGGSVLMHDGIGPGAQRGDCRNTIELVPALVAAARDQGLHVAPLQEQRGAPGRLLRAA